MVERTGNGAGSGVETAAAPQQIAVEGDLNAARLRALQRRLAVSEASAAEHEARCDLLTAQLIKVTGELAAATGRNRELEAELAELRKKPPRARR